LTLIHLDRDIVAKCKCGGQLWYIVVDQPDFEKILAFQCSFCGNMITINLSVTPSNPRADAFCKKCNMSGHWEFECPLRGC